MWALAVMTYALCSDSLPWSIARPVNDGYHEFRMTRKFHAERVPGEDILPPPLSSLLKSILFDRKPATLDQFEAGISKLTRFYARPRSQLALDVSDSSGASRVSGASGVSTSSAMSGSSGPQSRMGLRSQSDTRLDLPFPGPRFIRVGNLPKVDQE